MMGILNVTPDSFSDGGLHFTTEDAVAFAKTLYEEGADIIDVGGESTRPGAEPVSEEEEARRVFPVIEQLTSADIPVSIDTSKPVIACEAIRLGASVINDVTGLRNPEMLATVVQTGATVCIMHMLGEPRTMQAEPEYNDVVSEVKNYVLAKAQDAIDAHARKHRFLKHRFARRALEHTTAHGRIFALGVFPHHDKIHITRLAIRKR